LNHAASDPDAVRQITASGEGTIRETGDPFAFSLRFLTGRDAAEVYRLQQRVLEVAPRPLPLYVRDREFFARCAVERGCVVGAWHEDELIGYAVLHVPLPGEENYGAQLRLPDAELGHVGHLGGSGVHPRYRGNKIQSRMVDLRRAYAHAAGYHHMCGEVLPSNIISIRNHLDRGYFLKGFKIDRFELSVFLLHSDTRGSPRRLDETDMPEAPIDDTATYRRMLQAGRWGFRVTKRDDRWNLCYGRFA
jgi:GNAT superfamily N-acetyltransferase